MDDDSSVHFSNTQQTSGNDKGVSFQAVDSSSALVVTSRMDSAKRMLKHFGTMSINT